MKRYSYAVSIILLSSINWAIGHTGEPIHIERRDGSSWAYVTKSGSYYLEDDINQLSVQGENISIDLKGHSITGTGSQFALMIDGATSVKIFNGTVFHSQLYGIRIHTCTSVELHDLSIKKQQQSFFQILDAALGCFFSEDINLHDIHFTEDDGQWALKFIDSKAIEVRNCKIEGFLSAKPTIRLDKCTQALIENMEAYAQPTTTTPTDSEERLGWSVVCTGCSNVEFRMRFNEAQEEAV